MLNPGRQYIIRPGDVLIFIAQNSKDVYDINELVWVFFIFIFIAFSSFFGYFILFSYKDKEEKLYSYILKTKYNKKNNNNFWN